jgi:hypothetical protein
MTCLCRYTPPYANWLRGYADVLLQVTYSYLFPIIIRRRCGAPRVRSPALSSSALACTELGG